jgi:hypothetical protein
MKIMYVASQPHDGSQLNIGREISQFQQSLLSKQLPDFEMLFYGDISVQSLRSEITKVRPDILHISAHSDDGIFRLRNDRDEVVQLRADEFGVVLPDDAMPMVALFSSCDSSSIGPELQRMNEGPSLVIGYTGRVDYYVAFNVALQLYDDLLLGKTIGKSFENARKRTRLEQKNVELTISPESGSIHDLVLYKPPAIVARIEEENEESFLLEVGLADAPLDLVQIVFFTDSREWAPDNEFSRKSSLTLECWRASKMAKIVYGPVGEGRCIWSDTTEDHPCDERLFAAIIRSSQPPLLVKSTVSQALVLAAERGLVPRRNDAVKAAEKLKYRARQQ